MSARFPAVLSLVAAAATSLAADPAGIRPTAADGHPLNFDFESGTLAELRHLTRTEVSFAAEGIDPSAIEVMPAAHDVTVASGRIHFTADSSAIASVLPRLGELDVQSLTITPPSLEELFLRHYGDEIDAADSSLERVR